MTWKYEVSSDVIGQIIEAVATGHSEKIELPPKTDGIEVYCNDITIARLVYEKDRCDHRVVALSCPSGRHGVCDQKWLELENKIKSIGCSSNARCQLCNNFYWMPAYADVAKKQAVLSGMIGIYKGVIYNPSEKFKVFIKKASSATVASFF